MTVQVDLKLVPHRNNLVLDREQVLADGVPDGLAPDWSWAGHGVLHSLVARMCG